MAKHLAPFLSDHPYFDLPVAVVRVVDKLQHAVVAANAQFDLDVDMSRAMRQARGEVAPVPVRVRPGRHGSALDDHVRSAALRVAQ